MARTQGTSARTQRLIAGIATVSVAAASSIALGRVFEGVGPTLRLLLAGVVSAVIATLLERRSLVLATLVSIAGLAFAIGLLVFPDTTWLGLPSAETLRVSVEAAGRVGEQARVQVAPSPPLAPLMLAGIAGVWAAVFAAHSLAFRAGSPLLALMPPVALVGFADSVLEDVVRPIFGLLFLVAAAALLFADGLRRVQGWGPVWTGPGRASRLDVAAGRGARRVAAAALAVAAAAPILLPGFGSQGLVDFSTVDDDRLRVDPIVSVQESLQRDEEVPYFEVEAEVGRYWRMVALPDFDGQRWTPDPEPVSLPLSPGAPLTSTSPLIESGESTQVSITTTGELALPWLPMPYPATSADAPLQGMRWEPESGSIALEDGVEAGVTYTVTADVVQPTPDQLRREPRTETDFTLRYAQPPPRLSEEVRDLAAGWARGAGNIYDAVIAIQDRLTDTTEFTYDEDVPGSSSDRAMVEFLTETKRGFCQQFASSMAAMLRSLGIPTRLAVGFTPGRITGDSERFTVTNHNAHVWVEVLFPSFGWVPFEPTPNRQNLEAYPYLDPEAAESCVEADGSCPPGEGPGAGGPPNNLSNPAGLTAADRERFAGGGPRSGGGVLFGSAVAAPEPGLLTNRNVALAALTLIVLALALVPPVRAWRRRRRLRRAGPAPRSSILATYDVFTDRAAELGYPRFPGQTIEEYRVAVSAAGPLGNGDLDRLSRVTSDAAYAAREPDDDDVAAATRSSDAVVRAMRRHAGWGQRLTGPYRRR
jgi:transglutaminase-like putative cysteine protease